MYDVLLERSATGGPVRAGIVGAGHYGTAIITQSQSIPRLDVIAVADADIDAAQRAYARAGVPPEAIVICETRAQAIRALERQQRVVTEDAQLLTRLPLDVLVDATGSPEMGAQLVPAALDAGQHVAMVSKETDATIGPILHRMAQSAGLVYTAVDGDQHGLLIGLVGWARTLGLEIVAGGKARDAEFVYDDQTGRVTCGEQSVTLERHTQRALDEAGAGDLPSLLRARRAALAPLSRIGGYDVTELAVASNATGLRPQIETLYCPALRTVEIPRVFCPESEGGILERRGIIDAVTCLRRKDEAGLGGGVWIVVTAESEYSRTILATKGLLTNETGESALIYRPHHLCGVETPMSLLAAGLLKIPTAARDLWPHVDVIARARETLKAGDHIRGDHDTRLEYLLHPSCRVDGDAPIPLHMASGRSLAQDVPPGSLVRRRTVDTPDDSALWRLRAEQDRVFGISAPITDQSSATEHSEMLP